MSDEQIRTAYDLKREGAFPDALRAYANEYRLALDGGNSFVAEVCADQLVDVSLLSLLKEGQRFPDRHAICAAVEGLVVETLREAGVNNPAQLGHLKISLENLSKSKRKDFSVDPSWLMQAGRQFAEAADKEPSRLVAESRAEYRK